VHATRRSRYHSERSGRFGSVRPVARLAHRSRSPPTAGPLHDNVIIRRKITGKDPASCRGDPSEQLALRAIDGRMQRSMLRSRVAALHQGCLRWIGTHKSQGRWPLFMVYRFKYGARLTLNLSTSSLQEAIISPALAPSDNCLYKRFVPANLLSHPARVISSGWPFRRECSLNATSISIPASTGATFL
jgi:hypothetical protein